MKAIVHVVGARPNFMKLSPVYQAIRDTLPTVNQQIIHSGQHYDPIMSDVFFKQLHIPSPNINLSVNQGSAIEQIGQGILKLLPVLQDIQPDLVCIYGDVNAVAFASMVAAKLEIPIAHIESGLRSFDRQMPEETNRIVADALSDYLFTPSLDANDNLLKEGKHPDQIFFVGNVMIDTLIRFMPQIDSAKLPEIVPTTYGLVTLHRPTNVDQPKRFLEILDTLRRISERLPIVFPVHPRTQKHLDSDLSKSYPNIMFTSPMQYFEFIKLQKNATYVITDSGGVQEETTFLGVPCFTLRPNTERPVTSLVGTNILVGEHTRDLEKHINLFFEQGQKAAEVPPYWDGKASQRIAHIFKQILNL
ncbi:MAG: non-hydrolyzing UDP-N-acetylglucosamine 2-epimerase [Bernardetiaceae bacterium]